MSNSTNLESLVERAFEQRTDDLATVIEKENLREYELGFEDIIYADSINWAVVPCEEYMILSREHYDHEAKEIVAEYAIYSQHDRDGENIRNSLNMNAVYKLNYICDEKFASLAYAIAYAVNHINQEEE